MACCVYDLNTFYMKNQKYLSSIFIILQQYSRNYVNNTYIDGPASRLLRSTSGQIDVLVLTIKYAYL